jgi:glycosyltransferase involved in cell wall biosynthesis
MKLLSIVLSFRNEEENLPELVTRISSTMKKKSLWSYELIFVNDSSTDKSEQVLESLQKNYPIKIINLSKRFGNSSSILAGFEYSRGDCVVYLDSDLQDPPELIFEMINKYEEGYDIIHTKRIKRLGESFSKLFLTLVAYKIINLFSNIKLIENAGDFKLISRRALEEIKKLKEHEPYLRGLVTWVGFKQTILDYERQPRKYGLTKFPIFFSLGPVREFIRGITGFSMFPLYFLTALGMATFIISVFLIILIFYLKLKNILVSDLSSILIAITIFSGVIISVMGIFSLYLIRIYEEVRGRPRYIVETIKSKSNENK